MLPRRVEELQSKLQEDVEPAYTITEARHALGLSDSGMRKVVRERNLKTTTRRGTIYIPYSELVRLQRGTPRGSNLE